MTRLGYAIVFVTDMARSVAFYRDVLELSLRFESPDWTEFETGGTTLALHATPREGDAEEHSGPSPAGRCYAGFTVENIDAFHNRVLARGVRCLRPPTMEDFGAKLAAYADPDGLSISVSERH